MQRKRSLDRAVCSEWTKLQPIWAKDFLKFKCKHPEFDQMTNINQISIRLGEHIESCSLTAGYLNLPHSEEQWMTSLEQIYPLKRSKPRPRSIDQIVQYNWSTFILVLVVALVYNNVNFACCWCILIHTSSTLLHFQCTEAAVIAKQSACSEYACLKGHALVLIKHGKLEIKASL